jgi:hypothetical protein
VEVHPNGHASFTDLTRYWGLARTVETRRLAAIREECAIQVQSVRSLYRRVKVANALGPNIEVQQRLELDSTISQIFWEKVNPLLSRRYKPLPAKGHSVRYNSA